MGLENNRLVVVGHLLVAFALSADVDPGVGVSYSLFEVSDIVTLYPSSIEHRHSRHKHSQHKIFFLFKNWCALRG